MIRTSREVAVEGNQDFTGRDTVSVSLGAAGFALAVGYAIHVKNGYYAPQGLPWLSVGLAFLFVSLLLPDTRKQPRISPRVLAWVLAAGIILETIVLLWRAKIEPLPVPAIAVMSILGVLQLVRWARLKAVGIVLTVAGFSYAGFYAISLPNPGIDVYDWQQQTSLALTELHDPYLVRIAPRFPRHPGFYPPGAVDERGYLTCALPYPPLSLLMVLPGFVLGNDVRYADLFAIAASAVLMALVRSGRIAALAAMLFLLTPRVLYVLWNAWTEPLMVLTFSLVMFCACRWREGMPWALGLFLASKQTAVWALPLVVLLVTGPKLWNQLLWIAVKAGIVVAAINTPFVLWNFRQFVRAVVLLRAVPPFRSDALTYLVWVYSLTGKMPPTWIGAVVGAAAVVLVLWKAPRTPAGFAAGVTLVTGLFFAFSKQAFCNYYYFTIATACWAIAAAKGAAVESFARRGRNRESPRFEPRAHSGRAFDE